MRSSHYIEASQFWAIEDRSELNINPYTTMKARDFIAMLSRVKEWTITCTGTWETEIEVGYNEKEWVSQSGSVVGKLDKLNDSAHQNVLDEDDLLNDPVEIFRGWSGGRVDSGSGIFNAAFPEPDYESINIPHQQINQWYPSSPDAPFSNVEDRVDAQMPYSVVQFLYSMSVGVTGEDSSIFFGSGFSGGQDYVIDVGINFAGRTLPVQFDSNNFTSPTLRNPSFTITIEATEYWAYGGKYSTTTGALL